MESKKIIRLGSSLPVINIYPSDLRDVVNLEATMQMTTTWGADVIATVTPSYDPETNEITAYTVNLVRGEEVIIETVTEDDCLAIFAGKVLNARKTTPPKGLRNKLSFALNMNRDKRVNSMEELFDIYRDQIVIHDKMILSNRASTDKAYIPIRFDFGRLHIVAISDGFGQYNLSDGFFFVDGFLKPEETIEIMDNIPPRHVDLRKIDWVKSIIRRNPEEDPLPRKKNPEKEEG